MLLNLSNANLTVRPQLWTGEVFDPFVLPAGSVFRLENLPLTRMGISAGTFLYSFLGQTTEPDQAVSVEIVPLTIAEIQGQLPIGSNLIGSVRVFINGMAVTNDYLTDATPNTFTQIDATDTYIVREITFLADAANTDPVWIGSAAGAHFPLVAGASVSVPFTALSLWYFQSAAASQQLRVIHGGY